MDSFLAVPFKPDAIDPLRLQRKDFRSFRASAKQRGIAVEMTFEEWWAIWRPHWHRRMAVGGNAWLVLARKGDTGPYRIGNVYLTSVGQNARDAAELRRQRASAPGELA